MTRRTLVALAVVVASFASVLAVAGCGHGTAAASDRDRETDEELVEFLRTLERSRDPGTAASAEEREARRAAGTLALTIERPVEFADAHDQPPADHADHARLTAEEVLLSFAMYAEAARWGEQWELLSAATQRAWLDRIRREARRVGLPSVEARMAGADARRLWELGFASGGGQIDLAVRWRTRMTGDVAVISVIRGSETLDEVSLVHERGAWRLDLVHRFDGVSAASSTGDG